MTATTPPQRNEAPPAAKQGQLALRDANVPMVGSAAAFGIITRDGTGPLPIQGPVELSKARSEIYTLDRGETYSIQWNGYKALNAIVGAHFVLAPTVSVDGHELPSPYVKRDKNGKIEEVFIKGAMIARNRVGSLLVVAQTLQYSPEQYFIRDLFKAITDTGDRTEKADAGRLVRLKGFDESKLTERQVLYPYDDVVGIVVELLSPQVLKTFNTRNENHIFAVRKATTILNRRLCQAHPAMPAQRIEKHLVTEKKEQWQSSDGSRGGTKVVDATTVINAMGWTQRDNDTAEADALKHQIENSGLEAVRTRVIELDDATAVADAPEKIHDDPAAPAKREPPIEVRTTHTPTAMKEPPASHVDAGPASTPAPTAAADDVPKATAPWNPESDAAPAAAAAAPAADPAPAPAPSPREVLEETVGKLANRLGQKPGGKDRRSRTKASLIEPGVTDIAEVPDSTLRALCNAYCNDLGETPLFTSHAPDALNDAGPQTDDDIPF